MIGYTFRESWAAKNRATVEGFQRAVTEARQIMASSDAEWERLAPLTQTSDAETLRLLRERYREGVPETTADTTRDAQLVFGIVAELGGDTLTGGQQALAPGTFWEDSGG
jgi:NitT/TauT family transport system substrate-binding protein